MKSWQRRMLGNLFHFSISQICRRENHVCLWDFHPRQVRGRELKVTYLSFALKWLLKEANLSFGNKSKCFEWEGEIISRDAGRTKKPAISIIERNRDSRISMAKNKNMLLYPQAHTLCFSLLYALIIDLKQKGKKEERRMDRSQEIFDLDVGWNARLCVCQNSREIKKVFDDWNFNLTCVSKSTKMFSFCA